MEKFFAGVGKINGPCDLLSLDAACCTWLMHIFVIPIGEEETLLNGPSGSHRGGR